MDYKKLQNGSDIRGVALEGIEGQYVNLTEEACCYWPWFRSVADR